MLATLDSTTTLTLTCTGIERSRDGTTLMLKPKEDYHQLQANTDMRDGGKDSPIDSNSWQLWFANVQIRRLPYARFIFSHGNEGHSLDGISSQ